MNTNVSNFNSFGHVKGALRAASKTALNFTGEKAEDTLPACISINLDWFHYSGECLQPEPVENQDIYWVSDTMALEYKRQGTPNYKHSYTVILEGEPVANLHTHARDNKKMKVNRAKVELMNHVLYTTEWLNIYDQINEHVCVIPDTPGRMDIALDGVNHLNQFLNCYFKQGQHNQTIHKLGKAKGHPGVMGASMLFEYFRIGSAQKVISVYNKTKEIDQKSNKQYIRQVWESCGLDMKTDNFRCELRLKGEAIKEIKDFDVRKLTNPVYLLEIFKTQIENFFEFIILQGDKNVSRCKKIDLFNFKNMRITALDKVKRTVQRGCYKAKLAIHNGIANILLHHTRGTEKIAAAMNHIQDQLEIYQLHRFYETKLPDWIATYKANLFDMPGAYRQPAGPRVQPQPLLNMEFFAGIVAGIYK